jgi:hypothetical protein
MLDKIVLGMLVMAVNVVLSQLRYQGHGKGPGHC